MSGMAHGRPIVAGIDGSGPAWQAAMWAAQQAVRGRVGLRLVHAVDYSGFLYAGPVVPPIGLYSALERDGQEQLDVVRKAVHHKFPDLAIEMHVVSEHPVWTLINESERAGLVVIGSTAPDGASRSFAGSTAVGVAAHATSPVAIIPGGEYQTSTSGPVVVGIDGSPASEAAVAIAFEEASLRGTGLVAVHASTQFASDTEYLYAKQFIIDWSTIQDQQSEMLAERLAGWQEKFPDVTVRRVVTQEKAAQALLAHAEGAQLLVVGSRGHGGFTGLLLGSVSQKMIHHATCPLIVARPSAS